MSKSKSRSRVFLTCLLCQEKYLHYTTRQDKMPSHLKNHHPEEFKQNPSRAASFPRESKKVDPHEEHGGETSSPSNDDWRQLVPIEVVFWPGETPKKAVILSSDTKKPENVALRLSILRGLCYNHLEDGPVTDEGFTEITKELEAADYKAC